MRDYIGYLASALVLLTFCARTMIPLRVIALGSNVAFITYSSLLHLYPILALHVTLLPLNSWRLAQILLLGKRVQDASGTEALFVALLPFARHITIRQGEVLIRKGDPSDCLYLVHEGVLRVAEAGAELGPASVVDEMGVVSRTHLRTATVVARTNCVLGRVSTQDFDRVYYTKPALGLTLIRLIIDRLSEEVEIRRAESAAARTGSAAD